MGPDAKTFLFELGKETEAADMRAKIHILPPTKNLHACMAIQKGSAVAIMGSIPQEKELDKLPELSFNYFGGVLYLLYFIGKL